jgi:hypothetical protein
MATIGELTNVPEPGAPVASPWAQDVTRRIVHRFADVAAAAASNLTDGAVANIGGRLYVRVAGVWQIVAPPEFYSIPSIGVGAIPPGSPGVEVGTRFKLKAGLWTVHRTCFYGAAAGMGAQLKLVTGTLVGGLVVHRMVAHTGGSGTLVMDAVLSLPAEVPDFTFLIQNVSASGNFDVYSDPTNNYGYAVYYGPQALPAIPAGGAP